MIHVTEVTNKNEWEHFLLSQRYQPFFQSWYWGELNKKLENKIVRLGIFDGKRLVGICLAIDIKARRGHFLHLRHGPVLSPFQAKYFDPFLSQVQSIGKEVGADFLRVSPVVEETGRMREFFKQRGFHESPLHRMDAEDCWVLDLDISEEELLMNMRKTARYLVRKGEKEGIIVVRAEDVADVKKFSDLYQKTARKHGFLPHRGIVEEFELFKKDNLIELFLAQYKKKTVAGALVIFYGDQAVYHHGASDPKYDRLSPSYLLQWEAIKEAKRRRKKLYNFWGVAPADKPNHPWAGLTLFKKGFGGRAESSLHSQDFPLTGRYWLTWGLETLRRLTKGY